MAPSPSDTGQAKEPLDQVGTEPGKQAAPAESAMPPANEPLEQAGANEDQKQQQAADQPAELVISDLTEAQDGKKLVKPWNVPVDSIAQMDVLNAKGKKIGQVDAVLQDKDGNIKGVAVGYGGFLGFGEKGAIVTLDQMKLKNGALVTEVDEDQLSKLPEWKKK
jgi:sporulation protein YlmC with PRC-barrel domain